MLIKMEFIQDLLRELYLELEIAQKLIGVIYLLNLIICMDVPDNEFYLKNNREGAFY